VAHDASKACNRTIDVMSSGALRATVHLNKKDTHAKLALHFRSTTSDDRRVDFRLVAAGPFSAGTPSTTSTTSPTSTTSSTMPSMPGCAPVPPGIVSWWPGDDTASDRLGAHDGALQGTITFADAEVARGFVFDDASDLVSIADAPDLYPGAGSFTVDAWIKTSGPEASGGSSVIIRHYECANFCSTIMSLADWDLRIASGRLEGIVRDNDAGGNGQVLVGAASVEDGVFHHVALVRDVGAGKLRLYVDGVKDAEADLTADSDGTLSNVDGDADSVTIGGGILGGTGSIDPQVAYTGIIDEVDWFLSALSDQQIAAIAAAGAQGKCTN